MASTPFDITKLLQAPKKWTPRHLQGLNIQEHHHLPAAAIVGDALPADNGPCNYHPPINELSNMLTSQVFIELAKDLTEPTRHEILTGIWLPDNLFNVPLGSLPSAITTLERGQAPFAEMLGFADKFLVVICRRDKKMYFHTPFMFSSSRQPTD